jgi:murein DD-endopeptidase MepM/ murein hydrolase activator NlpD
VVTIGILVVGVPVEAGFFSFIGELLSGKNKTQEVPKLPPTTSIISQNAINLLNAPANADVSAGLGGSSVSFVQNNALLPVVGPLGSTVDVEEAKTGGTILTYTVHEGDTLTSIAKTFGVSVNTIKWANNVKSSTGLKSGDTLVILPVSGVKHKITSGDTLEIIAKKYKGDLNEILAFNDLSTNTILQLGDEIIIPDGEMVAFPTPKQSTVTASTKSLVNVSGYFINPVPTGVKTQGIHGNNGVDLGASCGDPIYAAASGNVILVRNDGGWNGGYGNYLVISHPNGTQTLYAHESVVYARVGSYIQQGELIGLVGQTGQSTGCHLHFEVRGARNPF